MHAGVEEDVQTSKFRSYVSCTNSVNETYLHTFLERIRRLKIFKDCPVEDKCEELYLAHIWKRVHRKEYHSKLAANNNGKDKHFINNNSVQMVDTPSAYENTRSQNIMRNNKRLIKLGLYSIPDAPTDE
mmetsp:Transcript_53794/g.60117  ORF Transcript_53794/g.60117 Transcript_53794/m.60117 type:complete len:129 (-) Transcript_53794:107-493(-)